MASDDLALLLQQTIERELPHLRSLSEVAAALKPAGKTSWSPKEELGHLIDSAANNHQRFVRAALEPEYRGPGYAQEAWVSLNGYRETPWTEVVLTWYQYNRLLVRTMGNIPRNKLDTPCFIGSAQEPETLGFIIGDYVLHMQHHIDHLLGREQVTPYPSQAKTAL
ncbi:MAG: DinB family protein [Acidobacteriota bacterium]|nr:DinB family protein [Acidobacteriota bacterium]